MPQLRCSGHFFNIWNETWLENEDDIIPEAANCRFPIAVVQIRLMVIHVWFVLNQIPLGQAFPLRTVFELTLAQCGLWGHSSKGPSLIGPKIEHHWKYNFMTPPVTRYIASNGKVHPLHEQGYVITCVGNHTEEKFLCMHIWISHRRVNAGSVFKIDYCNFLMMT